MELSSIGGLEIRIYTFPTKLCHFTCENLSLLLSFTFRDTIVKYVKLKSEVLKTNGSAGKFTASFKLNAIKLGEENQNTAQVSREQVVKASLIHR